MPGPEQQEKPPVTPEAPSIERAPEVPKGPETPEELDAAGEAMLALIEGRTKEAKTDVQTQLEGAAKRLESTVDTGTAQESAQAGAELDAASAAAQAEITATVGGEGSSSTETALTSLDREMTRELTAEEQAELGALRAQVEKITPSQEDKRKISDITQAEKDLQKLADNKLLIMATKHSVEKSLGKDNPTPIERQDALQKRFSESQILNTDLTTFYRDATGKPHEAKRANPSLAVLGEFRDHLQQLAGQNEGTETSQLQEERVKQVLALADTIRAKVQEVTRIESAPRELLGSVRQLSTQITQAESHARNKLNATVRAEGSDDRGAQRQDAKTKYMQELENLKKELSKKIGLE